MDILLNCYANNYMPEIWKDILYVFQHNGFPCGWKGDYPEGKMIVFLMNDDKTVIRLKS